MLIYNFVFEGPSCEFGDDEVECPEQNIFFWSLLVNKFFIKINLVKYLRVGVLS